MIKKDILLQGHFKTGHFSTSPLFTNSPPTIVLIAAKTIYIFPKHSYFEFCDEVFVASFGLEVSRQVKAFPPRKLEYLGSIMQWRNLLDYSWVEHDVMKSNG